MKKKEPKSEETCSFSKEVVEQTVVSAIKAHIAHLKIYKSFKNRQPLEMVFWETIPCHSNLYRLINNIFFSGTRENREETDISEEDLTILKLLFDFRKRYDLWKEGYQILKEKGKIEASIWIKEKAKMLGLLKIIKGEE